MSAAFRISYLKRAFLSALWTSAVLASFILASTLPDEASAQHAFVEGEVIVKLKGDGSRSRSLGFSSKAAGQGIKIHRAWTSQNLHHMKALRAQSTQQLMAELSKDPDVEYVEPNYIVKKGDIEAIRADEMKTQSVSFSGMLSFVSGLGLTTAPIQGVDAWAHVSGSARPVVAVIDTGADLNHLALKDAIWINQDEIAGNGIDDDGNGYVDDRHGWNFVNGNNDVQDCDGHGTHVSGIVRGTTQFIFDAQNLSTPVIQIMPVKFLDCYGSGTTAGAIAAINYAVANGAKILNNSWGGGGYSRALNEAILASYNAKTLFVAAAGNSKNNNDVSKTYPANYGVPNVVAVLATRSSDDPATDFTNYGRNTVQVGAPGSGIWSAYPDFWGDPWCDDDSNSATYEGCFRSMSGTSMAAPFVSGIAALMAVEKPTMTGYQLKQILMTSVDKKSSLNSYVSTGGRVNSLTSVTAAKVATVDPYQPPYEISFSEEERGLASAIGSGGAGGCGTVATLRSLQGRGEGGTPYGLLALLSALALLPILLALRLRKQGPEARRAFVRYKVQSRVRIRTSLGVELEADLSTLSVAGAGLTAQTELVPGSQISVRIEAPNGEFFDVQGHVVWSDDHQSVGVRFDELLSSNLLMAMVRN